MKSKLLSIAMLFAANALAFAQYSSALFPVGTTGVSVKLETTPSIVRVTLVGPSNSYLAIGAGTSGMANGSDGFIYSDASTRDYGFTGVGIPPTPDAVQDWTVVSNTVSGTTRTVIATRSLNGGPGDIPIPNAAGNLEIFVARGNNTLTLSNHGGANRGYATLVMAFDASLATSEVHPDVKQRFKIYPNPAKGTVNFENVDKIKSVDIYETAGRKVKTVKVDGANIDVSGLKSGNYYFEITLKDGSLYYEKLIKE
ncbi:T9SS type A sorting domain-containing protein [Chryseobacterium zhengzhouense]|uniref:T9SS type A sorting domain-containing protein n=1 Tax=Chryseobacterium zhengzhouense TaxID=1636086 RepID=A0ABW2LZG0_9FLAO